jgi:hypothetical protein
VWFDFAIRLSYVFALTWSTGEDLLYRASTVSTHVNARMIEVRMIGPAMMEDSREQANIRQVFCQGTRWWCRDECSMGAGAAETKGLFVNIDHGGISVKSGIFLRCTCDHER